MSPQIQFEVDGVPPIKRGYESMWAKQLDRVRDLRREAVKRAEGLQAAAIGDEAVLEVAVWALPRDGDLDGDSSLGSAMASSLARRTA